MVANINQPITLQQAAEYLQVHYQTCWEWADSGRLGARRLGRLWRTTIADCDKLLGAPSAPALPPPRQQSQASKTATRELERRGVM